MKGIFNVENIMVQYIKNHKKKKKTLNKEKRHIHSDALHHFTIILLVITRYKIYAF